jgi:hypothetical protein
MLELAEVDEIVKKAATAALEGQAGVQRVYSEPTLDSSGEEALQITIVLNKGSAGKISGDGALRTLVSIDRALNQAKEERFPIIDFVTEEELAEEELESDGDPET